MSPASLRNSSFISNSAGDFIMSVWNRLAARTSQGLRERMLFGFIALSLTAAPTSAGFITAPVYPPGGVSLAVADFNRDGILDIAEINSDGGVSILLGKGDGTFLPAQNYDAGGVASAVTVGDFNGDGIPDLAVVNNTDSDATVGILLGNGD